MANISERLKMLRKEKKLTQLQLSKKLKSEVSDSMIGSIERGEREGSLDTIKVLADFFEVSVDYLTGKSDERNLIIETEEVRESYINKFINDLIENGTITSCDSIDNKETADAILNMVKAQVALILGNRNKK